VRRFTALLPSSGGTAAAAATCPLPLWLLVWRPLSLLVWLPLSLLVWLPASGAATLP